MDSFEFYLIITPGFEKVAELELRAWWPNCEARVDRGGITVLTDSLADGFALNRKLKIPNRILLRVMDFGCRDFPKLFKKLSNFNWGQWIPDSAEIDFHVSSHASRLFVKRRIEETCLDARKKYLKQQASLQSASKVQASVAAPKEAFGVWVRLDDDVCYVSLDTSGEILHKRGERELSSDAPLRESTAAGMLWTLIASMRSSENSSEFSIGVATEGESTVSDISALKDPSSVIELVDPMMGGGTLLLEGSSLHQSIGGVSERKFAYDSFTHPQKSEAPKFLHERLQPTFAKFSGLEIDAKTIAAAKENLENVAQLDIHQGDIFADAKPLPDGRRWLACNPPYGERIKIKEPFSSYYPKLFEACEKWARPEKALFLIPEKAKPSSLRHPREWKKTDEIKFSNGGIPVRALVFERINK